MLLVFDDPFWERTEGKRDFWGITARLAPNPDLNPIRNPTPDPSHWPLTLTLTTDPDPNPDPDPDPKPNPKPKP